MNTAKILGLAAAVVAMATAACSAETTEEKTGQSEDHFDVACVQNIHAPAGSAAWHAALQACLADVGGGAGAGGGGGTSQSCSISKNCINNSCTCGSGPNAGAACNAALVSGPSACNVLCRYCR